MASITFCVSGLNLPSLFIATCGSGAGDGYLYVRFNGFPFFRRFVLSVNSAVKVFSRPR
jgi:hypothetical protein